MSDGRLWLTAPERQWLAMTLPSDYTWPSGEHQLPLLGQLPGFEHETAGGPRLRAQLLALRERAGNEPAPLDLTLSELWLLDSLMVRQDLRLAKLPDGAQLLTLAEKVWALLVAAHEEQLPPHLRKEVKDAEPRSDPDPLADAVADAEAILRPGNGPRTGEDLPPAAP